MKIAAAQTTVSASLAANGEAIRGMIAAAAAEGARLVHFCEGALSGYAKAQIGHPEAWSAFDWEAQETELRAIAALCRRLRIFAVVGGAHRLSGPYPPHNSLYVLSDAGELVTRYDKRYLSNSELQGWYTPGTEAISFDVNGYRFGCAICIESQFFEVFSGYERQGVDAVLFSSYGIPGRFQIALRAHAGLNCIWISAATPAQVADRGPAGIIGPDGKSMALCPQSPQPALVTAVLDRDDPAYDIALNKARPWRRQARQGDIYREKCHDDARSRRRDGF
ncbi:putative amidohydrolase [Rhizobium azooxidifex]|uniref:Putative amidohydrolase n=1 Tax=Mycoplana azooxidifex TaxID=1636188 RepID=A0A7W6DBX2_9HYPH|nr:carbon-nitrogen hydrolase family protein [Mycoplana azooxidifex]MBB3976109.1 putative amidohydrolase [Mycoplana azooxidifex]